MSTPTPMRPPFRALSLAMALAFAHLPALGDDHMTDRLGISFDSQYYQYCAFLAPFEPVTMYVVLTEPSFAELHGWEAAIRLPDGGNPLLLWATAGLGGQNTGTLPEFAVAYPSPVPTTDLMVLATVSLFPTSWAECLVLTGIHSPSLPDLRPLVWPQEGAPMAIVRSAVWPNGVTAATGGCPVIPGDSGYCGMVLATEPASWGAVKARYR